MTRLKKGVNLLYDNILSYWFYLCYFYIKLSHMSGEYKLFTFWVILRPAVGGHFSSKHHIKWQTLAKNKCLFNLGVCLTMDMANTLGSFLLPTFILFYIIL